MKIVILTVDHMYANKVVKDVLDRLGSEVKVIIKSDSLLHNKTFGQSLKKYYLVSGLYYIIAQAVKLEIYKLIYKFFSKLNLGGFDSKFYHFERLAKQKKIPVREMFNINSDAGIKLLKKHKPDLIVSILFNQLLGRDVIRIPKRGVINIHPAYLPDYKGVSPVFWALSNSEKEVGVSVHNIDLGIDTGSILSRKKVIVKRTDTEDSLYWELVTVGSPLLISVIEKIRDNIKVNSIRNKGGRYFSIPTKAAIKKYLRKRKAFFRLSDVLK